MFFIITLESKEVKTAKSKRKNPRRKEQHKNNAPVCAISNTSSTDNATKVSNRNLFFIK